MRTPRTVRSAEDFGRIRLSRTFFMRDFLYSEIANIHGMTNLPLDPDVAVAAGRGLCETLLEPLQATFGRLAIRSGYRSPEVNAFGNAHFNNCASNEFGRARHIWDQRSEDSGMGAMATIVVPWMVDRLDKGMSWLAMAWWIPRQSPLQRVAVLSETRGLQHRLARDAASAHHQLYRAARASDQARNAEPRGRSQRFLSGLSATGESGETAVTH